MLERRNHKYKRMCLNVLRKCSSCNQSKHVLDFTRESRASGIVREFKTCNRCTKKHFKYFETHKKERLEYRKATVEKSEARQRTKVLCECGCTSTKRNISTHRKTKKHARLMLALEETKQT
jgi:hypothetical protein